MFFGGSGLCLSGGYVCLQWFLVGLWCGRRIDGVFFFFFLRGKSKWSLIVLFCNVFCFF